VSAERVGRIGYVLDGDGRGREIEDAKSEIRCNKCRNWFDGRDDSCPMCGCGRPGFSKPVRTGQLNRHLYEQAGLREKSGDFRI
jgi:ribosomal protein L37E